MLQPRFFPRTQLQPRLSRNPGTPSRARVSLADGTSGAICWTRPEWSSQTRARGRALGLPQPFQCPAGGHSLFPAPVLTARPQTRPPVPLQPPSSPPGLAASPCPPALLPRLPAGVTRAQSSRERLIRASLRLRRGRWLGALGPPPLAPPPHRPAARARGCQGDACRRRPERATRGNFSAGVAGRSA